MGHCNLKPLCAAFHHGSQRARAAAEKAIPKVKAAVAGATYWAGFGVSFAAVFSFTLAKGLAPEALKAGVRDGAKAGRESAEDWMVGREPEMQPEAGG